MDKRAVFESIARRIAAGDLVFPTGSTAALQLYERLSDPDCHLAAMTTLVRGEPLLAARVVGLANSVAYNPYGREVSDLGAAIGRIGISAVRSLAMALGSYRLAGEATSPVQRELRERLWMHTAHVAALARVLARITRIADPETALFAGLVHELPGFYLIACAGDQLDLLDGDDAEWIDSGERAVGRPLLATLGIPENIRQALEVYWEGYLSLPPHGLGDLLLLAEELSPEASPLHAVAGAKSGDRAELDMLLGEKLVTDMLRETSSEVSSLRQALAF